MTKLVGVFRIFAKDCKVEDTSDKMTRDIKQTCTKTECKRSSHDITKDPFERDHINSSVLQTV
jgi:hypothetical protein